MTRLRVLLLAESANPRWPSLPVVGYKAARAIADQADVTVATHVRNREAIEAEGFGRAEAVFIDNEYIARPMHRLATMLRGGNKVGWTTSIAMQYLPYLAFEREVWKRFGDDLRDGRFDIVHRITPMTPTHPSLIARRCPVPFVLGPLNGGLRWPRAFSAERRREREWLSYLRRAYRWLPYYRSTYRCADVILAAFAHTITDLPAGARERAIDFPEVGIDPTVFTAPPHRSEDQSVTFLFVGRLVPYKCCDIALEAFASLTGSPQHRFVIVGDGPERARLENIAASHGIADRVHFAGWMSQADVGQQMRNADVFVFPSIRELGAGVVVEAMACGLACVVTDYGGPGGLIDESTGVKISLSDRAGMIEQFSRTMTELAGNRSTMRRLGDAARTRALSEYSWDAKARKTIEVYRWALGERTPPPRFIESDGGNIESAANPTNGIALAGVSEASKGP